jgi:hypothetical protein
VNWLDADDIDDLFNAVINSGLTKERDALFANVLPRYYLKIPETRNPSAQVRIDLGHLNSGTPLADGSVPFRAWLRTAYSMTEGTAEGEVFQRKLLKLEQKLSPQLKPAAVDVKGTGPDTDRLEKIVRQKMPFVDAAAWRTRLALREAAVARVELRHNGMWKAAGTGFLVGADLLMTNHHVIRELLGQQGVKDNLRFRFDFKRTAEGETPQAGSFASPAGDWLVASAEPSPVDELKDPGNQEPAEEHLDFALIRLALPVGALPMGTNAPGTRRGWMHLHQDTSLTLLGEGQSLFILQHPEGDALQITFGDILKVGTRRVRYNANTLRGSSGSPCLDARLEVVALHHAGDANHGEFDKAGYNQGIPIHLIVARCNSQGVTFEPPPA